jgi:hypothetical protein
MDIRVWKGNCFLSSSYHVWVTRIQMIYIKSSYDLLPAVFTVLIRVVQWENDNEMAQGSDFGHLTQVISCQSPAPSSQTCDLIA